MEQPDGHDDRHDRGLQYDLATLWQRRRLLQVFSGVAVAAIVGCSGDDDSGAGANTATAAARTPATSEGTAPTATLSPAIAVTPIPTSSTPLSACTTIPEETVGPYPGDGSNGPNALVQSGIVRSHIRTSFGTSTTVASGVPFEIELTIVDTQDGCTPMAGAAVYLWHVDSQGRYSMYSQGATQENYLRGVQVADDNGVVRFTSIFPATYMGRWPHVHFEVYRDLEAATSSANKLATSQLAIPEDVCRTVYARSDYPQSLSKPRADAAGTRHGLRGRRRPADGGNERGRVGRIQGVARRRSMTSYRPLESRRLDGTGSASRRGAPPPAAAWSCRCGP